MKAEKEYYLYKGDEVIATGTAKEIAKKLGISESTVRFYKNPSYFKRRENGKNYRVLVCVEEEQ